MAHPYGTSARAKINFVREQSGPDSPATLVRRRRSRWVRWLRRVALGLILLALGLLVVLHLPPVQRALVATALDALRTRQSLDISYSNLRFNLITRSVRIDDLRVGGKGAPLPLVTAVRAAAAARAARAGCRRLPRFASATRT